VDFSKIAFPTVKETEAKQKIINALKESGILVSADSFRVSADGEILIPPPPIPTENFVN